MAMTPNERKRQQREREKEQADREQRSGGDAAADLFQMPFSEWVEQSGNMDDLLQYTALAGFELPPFDNERDPESFVIDRECYGEEALFKNAKGALGRAEVTIGILQDTALLIAEAVNHYKCAQIKKRLSEIERSNDLERATAMKEAVRLNKMLDQLTKQVRRSFPQWKVMGD